MINALQLRGVNTAWIQKGNPMAHDILFVIHGFPDDPTVYTDFMDTFSKKYLVIAPYLRGVGESKHQPGRYRFESSCLDFLGILRSLEVWNLKDPLRTTPRLHILGHDLGGALAYALASLCPKQLRSLIIVNSLSLQHMRARLLRSPQQMYRSRYMLGFMNPLTQKSIHPGQLLRQAASITGRPAHLKNVPEATAKYRVENAIHHYEGFLTSTWPKSPKIRSHVLHLHGKDDPFLYPPTHEEIQDLCPKLDIRILEGSHWLLQDHPKECYPLIEDFICKQLS